MSDHLASIEAFLKVAELNSFSAAARQLDKSKSTVSKLVSGLEARLGSRLLNRTTRKLSLTDAGERYREAVAPLIEDLQAAEDRIAGGAENPTGRLRLSLPLSFGVRWIAPLIPAFQTRYPGLTLDLEFSDRRADLVGEGYDAALRIGKLQDSSLIAKRLSEASMVLCAAPSYLDQHGTPRSVDQLLDHRRLSYSPDGPVETWQIGQGASRQSIPAEDRVKSSNGDALLAMALAGMGIVYLPSFIACDAIRDGRLRWLFADHAMARLPISLLMPSGRHRPAKLAAFSRFLSEALAGSPPWDLAPGLGQGVAAR